MNETEENAPKAYLPWLEIAFLATNCGTSRARELSKGE
jgi:hypothetical protein